MSVAIVDYGLGNLTSVLAALDELQVDYVIDDDGTRIPSARIVLVPGVAAFGAGLQRIRRTKQADAIVDHWTKGDQLIGLCLGAQMFLESSDESPAEPGLGLVKGQVRSLNTALGRVPNQGWCLTRPTQGDALRHLGLSSADYFYYSHSYRLSMTGDSPVWAQSSNGNEHFTAVYGEENVIGIQFHPERSGKAGLTLLSAMLANTPRSTFH